MSVITTSDLEKGEQFKSNLKSVRISVFILRLSLAAQLVFFIIEYIFCGIFLLTLPDFFRSDAFYALYLGILLIVGAIYLGWTQAEHRFSIFPIILILYFCDRFIWMDYIKGYTIFGAFVDIWVYLAVTVVIGIISVIWCLIHILIITRARIKQKKLMESLPMKSNRRNYKMKLFWTLKLKLHSMKRGMKKHPIINILLIGIFIFSSVTVALYDTHSLPPSGMITIAPKNYQMQLAFWGSFNPNRYTAAEKQSLNEHHVLIIAYGSPDILDHPNLVNSWVNTCLYWKDNYPNVKIMPVAQGIPGVATWDGSATRTTELAKLYLLNAWNNSLTNIAGINTDQEAPSGLNVSQTSRSQTRNAEADVIWQKFFEWVNNTFPVGRFEFQTTFSGDSILDTFDHDNNLDVNERNNVLGVPYWSEYAPMYYEASGSNYEPGIISADLPNYRLYEWMEMLQNGLDRNGLGNRMGVYIGITNTSIFGAATKHSIDGKFAGYGYDALVTQALIAKSFGIRQLTIFTLTTEPEPGENNKYLMGGVFDSYGPDFLDKFNESINGSNSTVPFQIPALYDNNFYLDESRDIWYDRGMVIVASIMLFVFSVMAFYSDVKNKEKLIRLLKRKQKTNLKES